MGKTMGSIDKQSFFRESPWMSGVPRVGVDAVSGQARCHRVGRGEAVFEVGDPVGEVYWVVDGVARVSRPGARRRSLTLRFHGPGDVFGLGDAFGEGVRETTALAHDPLVLLGLPVDDLRALTMAHPPLSRRLLGRLVDRQRALQSRLASMVFQPVRDRLMTVLSELGRDFGVPSDGDVVLQLRLTQRELSDLIGASRETVAVALGALRRDGRLERRGRRWVLLGAGSG